MHASRWPSIRRPGGPLTAACVAGLVALACAGCGGLDAASPGGEPDRRRAVAQYQVDRPSWPGFPGDSTPDYDAGDRETQAAYVTSPFVLTAALAAPDIAKLPLLAEQDDPTEWLANHLRVDYPANGRLMEIELADDDAPLADLKKIVEAVSRAYYEEVVFRDRSMRQQPLAVLKRTRYQTREIRLRKATELRELLGDGSSDADHAAEQRLLRDEIRLLRRERLWTERRLVEQGVGGVARSVDEGDGDEPIDPAADAAAAEAWAERLGELDRRIAAAIDRIAPPPPVAQEVIDLRRELARLQASEDALAERIDELELALQAPPRVIAVGAARGGHALAETFAGGSGD